MSDRETPKSHCHLLGSPTRRRLILGAAVVLTLVLSASRADAGKVVKYRGIHPLAPHTGEFCYIELAHVHAQPPSDMRAYRVLGNGDHVFVGDEAALGYSGAKHAYFGPHPLTLAEVPPTEHLYCYLRGAHFHSTPPAPSASFVSKDGVAWFTGTFPPEFERDRFNVWVNDMRPIAAYRAPQVTLAAAPPGYRLPAAVELPVVVSKGKVAPGSGKASP